MFNARSTGSGADWTRPAGVRYLYKGMAVEEEESDGAAEEESRRQVGVVVEGRDEVEDWRTSWTTRCRHMSSVRLCLCSVVCVVVGVVGCEKCLALADRILLMMMQQREAGSHATGRPRARSLG